MANCFAKGLFFVEVLFEFPVIAHEVMYGVVNGKADGNAGDQACCHGQGDPEPSHHSETDDDGKTVWQECDDAYLVRHEQQTHDGKHKDQGQAQALDLAFRNEMAAMGNDNTESCYLK